MSRLLLALLALGCAAPEQASLFVDLRTDYAPELEVVAARVRLQGADGSADAREVALFSGDTEVFRVGSFVGVEPGEYELSVELLTPSGASLAEDSRSLEVTGNRAIVVAIERSCEHVSCAETEVCVDARCETPTCEEGADCFTGSTETSDVGECRRGTIRCADPFTVDECFGEQLPRPERTDSLDNDCDHRVDEGSGLATTVVTVAANERAMLAAFELDYRGVGGPPSHVYARRVLASGADAEGSIVRLSGVAGGRSPAVAYTPAGEWVVSWLARDGPDGASQLHFAWLDEASLQITAESTSPLASQGVDHFGRRLEVDPDGAVLRLGWDADFARTDLALLRAVRGGAVDTHPLPSVGDLPFAFEPRLAMNSEAGRLLVAWASGSTPRGLFSAGFHIAALDGTHLGTATLSAEAPEPVRHMRPSSLGGGFVVGVQRDTTEFSSVGGDPTFFLLDEEGAVQSSFQETFSGQQPAVDLLALREGPDGLVRSVYVITDSLGQTRMAYGLREPDVETVITFTSQFAPASTAVAAFPGDGRSTVVAALVYDGVTSRGYLSLLGPELSLPVTYVATFE